MATHSLPITHLRVRRDAGCKILGAVTKLQMQNTIAHIIYDRLSVFAVALANELFSHSHNFSPSTNLNLFSACFFFSFFSAQRLLYHTNRSLLYNVPHNFKLPTLNSVSSSTLSCCQIFFLRFALVHFPLICSFVHVYLFICAFF